MATITDIKRTPIGDWVDQLFEKLFFQPDDELAMTTWSESIAPELVVKVNNIPMTHEKYFELVKQARAKDVMTLQSNDEIVAWESPDGSGGGVVSHLGRWTRKDKETGEAKSFTNLTVANVVAQNGKKVLIELTEIMT